MTKDAAPSEDIPPADPTDDPDHPMAGAGHPVSEGEARKNKDREPPV